MNYLDGPADRAFADLVTKAEADPAVLGLFLHGSHAFEGMATAHSDYDLAVVTDDSEQGRRWRGEKTKELDWGPIDLAAYRCRVLDGLRWPDGAERWPTFPARSRERLPTTLDAYVNLLYRSLKSWRDGRSLEAHLDAAESVDLALWVIFGMHERLRPPNKYLRWELERRPFDTERWDGTRLLGRIQRILTDGNPETQRSLFRDIESTARANGLGGTVDGWGIDLKFMRGDQ